VPPPTIHSENDRYPSVKAGEIDDGQYREDPNIYLDPKYNSKPASNKVTSTFRINAQNAQPQLIAKPFVPAQNVYQTTASPVYENPQTSPPQFYQSRFQATTYQPQQNYYQPQSYNQPKANYNNYNPQTPNIFAGHPAQNIDIFSGSYTIAY
jgi:hypothetical protein